MTNIIFLALTDRGRYMTTEIFNSIGLVCVPLLLLIWAFCWEMNYRERHKDEEIEIRAIEKASREAKRYEKNNSTK